jgi:hypothetical protein
MKELVNTIASTITAAGIVFLWWQIRLYQREYRDDHERSRRENAVQMMLEWAKKLDRGIWLLNNCKNGVSSVELSKDIGVTQKTAWFMLHRIRAAMHRGTLLKMGNGGGEAEADETFIGGLSRNMHAWKRAEKITGTGGAGKELVMGLLDRETGKVHVRHVANRKKKTLQAEVKATVAKGAQLMTDELASYTRLETAKPRWTPHTLRSQPYTDWSIC